MNRTVRNVLIAGAVVSTLAASYVAMKIMTSDGGFISLPFSDESMLSGPPFDAWNTPAFEPAPVVLPGASWSSIPARTADGSVVGLVQDRGQGSFVKLAESDGRVLWQLPTGPVPDTLSRSDAWRVGEVAPAVPLTLAGPGVYLVAGGRTWLLVADTGASFKSGNFPEAVPPVAPGGGACLVDGKFWIAIEDGRDGGVFLAPDGTLAATRSDRPASCRRLDSGGTSRSVSPLQNAGPVPTPPAADDHTQGYPLDHCGKYSKQSRAKFGREYCSDLRSDGPDEHAIVLKIGDPTFRDGDSWQHIRMPDNNLGGSASKPDVVGFELAYPRAFFNLAAYRRTTRENNPSPSSFEPRRVENITEVIELVASISRTGELQWARRVQLVPLPAVSSTFYDNVVHQRSLLLASHPESPTQNLYLFKPGHLLAVDQATGAPRFQVGAPYPLPTSP